MLRLNLMTKPLQSVSIKNVGGIEVDGEELAGDWRCTQRRASRDVGLRCLRLDPAPEGGVCGRGRNPTLRIWASDIPRLD